MPKGSVKIMLSYDYCHFEICLGSDENMKLDEIDNIRKDAQRLADKAIEQYKMAKKIVQERINAEGDACSLRREVKAIKENFPQSEWTDTQKAKVKRLSQYDYLIDRRYDYEDDYDYEEEV